jgi:ankyrin repeat protein
MMKTNDMLLACQTGDCERVSQLLECGVDVTVQDDVSNLFQMFDQ